MSKVSNNKLFDIDDIGDQQNVDEEECENGDVTRSFRQWYDAFVLGRPPSDKIRLLLYNEMAVGEEISDHR